MNSKEAYELGRDAGYSAGMNCDFDVDLDVDGETPEECFVSAAYESEENARQYSPFEFHAHDMNSARNPDACWEAYDKGVGVGIRKAWRERRAEILADSPVSS